VVTVQMNMVGVQFNASQTSLNVLVVTSVFHQVLSVMEIMIVMTDQMSTTVEQVIRVMNTRVLWEGATDAVILRALRAVFVNVQEFAVGRHLVGKNKISCKQNIFLN